PLPPAAPRHPHRLEAHGHVRVDDWYWLSDRSNPEVLAYLQAENDYADPDRSRAAEDVVADARAGRPSDQTGEQVLLDENLLAGDGGYLAVGVFDVSPDQLTLAYATDLDGSETYTLRFRDLESGRDHDDVIEGVYYGSAWAMDNRTFFYVRPDHAMRPWQV